MRLVAERAHVIAEGAAGCAVAAALSGRAGSRQGRRRRLGRQHRSGAGSPSLVGAVTAMKPTLRPHLRPDCPSGIARLDELAIDLWWSWHPERATVFRRLDYPLWRATAHNPVRMLWPIPPRSSLRRRPPIPSSWRSTTARSRRSTTRARRGTRGGRDGSPQLERPVDRLLLRRVRAASVAADLRRRPRRARRRSLQGSRRPRRAAHRRRLHVPAGLLPPAPLGRRLAGGELRAAQLGRRADRAGADAGRQAVHHRRAARRSIGARRRSGASASAASRSTCSTPISRRTRRGIASCRRGSTAAIARRASSRRSSSASAASARCKALGIDPAVFHLNEGHAGVRRAAADPRPRSSAASTSTTRSRKSGGRRSSRRTRRCRPGHDAFPFHLVEKHLAGCWGTLGANRDRFLALGVARQRRRPAVQHDGARAAIGRRDQRASASCTAR